MLLTWSFVELFLYSEKSIVHNRKFLPKSAEIGHAWNAAPFLAGITSRIGFEFGMFRKAIGI